MANRLYLDNNATTPPAPEVIQEHSRVSALAWGNPSSLHADGRTAKEVLDQSRQVIANALNCQPDEVVFTGGGTESDNTAIRSAIRCYPQRRHIVCSAVEHDAVLHVVAELEKEGYRVTRVQPDAFGQIRPEDVARAITPHTAIVAVMAANNETGIVNDIYSIGQVARQAGVDYLVDATQALGKIPLDFDRMGATYLAASAHKLHGLKGTGILVVRSSCSFKPMMLGGGQEEKRRAGTQNVAGAAAFAKAVALCYEPRAQMAAQQVRAMRDRLEAFIRQRFGRDAIILGERAPRLWNTLYVCFNAVRNRDVLEFLDRHGIEVGIGSACSCLKDPQPSATVRAMRVPHSYQGGAVRFSFNRYQSPAYQADPHIVDRVIAALEELAASKRPASTHSLVAI